jgi:hypothetical protein
MAGPFKMKGSPMQRNFGIGSPLRQEGLKKERKELKKIEIGPKVNQMVDKNKNKISDFVESRESLEGKSMEGNRRYKKRYKKPQVNIVKPKKDGNRNVKPPKPKKGTWFGLPDFGITEATSKVVDYIMPKR